MLHVDGLVSHPQVTGSTVPMQIHYAIWVSAISMQIKFVVPLLLVFVSVQSVVYLLFHVQINTRYSHIHMRENRRGDGYPTNLMSEGIVINFLLSFTCYFKYTLFYVLIISLILDTVCCNKDGKRVMNITCVHSRALNVG